MALNFASSRGEQLVCSACGDEVTRHGDNRWRGCKPCGWRMHHGCWIEALTDGEIPCPYELVVWERSRLVETGEGFTASGKPKRRRVTEQVESKEHLDGHGEMIGMVGEW